jgi:glycosyltransferase involved in cell wall biosynthesis
VSRYLASQAVLAGFDSSRLEVHYQGIDTDFFTPSPESSPAAEPPTIAFVGALSERKGARDLIQVSRRLIGTLPHRLVLAGGGPLAAELAAETADDRHICLTGPLDREEVRTRLRNATVLVLPTKASRGGREAAGLVLLEAQACGTPVVAYDSGGTSEMLAPDVSGLLVPEGNTEALAAAVGDILTLGGADYARMRDSARDFAVRERSLAGSCGELLRHYDAVSN